jgi:hypothetical protein
MAVLG